ncbi:MAG TPA: hypothetical protein VL128_04225 [Candidatus Eisenbacteria bacterium]|nr:hypothetical protein [Candidatus Eisenbacteria bacterium]
MKISLGRFLCLSLSVTVLGVHPASSQAVPYARSFAKPRIDVEQALKEMQAYSGQKLPTLDGFVALGDKPLDRYERGYYQFSIDLLPGDSGGTIVRLTAKITAWYADRDVAKSGYQVLPSNGRLELDFLDRLQEKLTGKPVVHADPNSSSVQAPRPKLDLSSVSAEATMAGPVSPSPQPPDEVAGLRNQRVTAEKRVQQLAEQLKNLQDIQHSQAHPQDLIVVKKADTPVFSRPSEDSHLLFHAATNDEFEFLDADHGWIHVTISGDSRGYLRADSVELPQRIAEQMDTRASALVEKFPGFHVEREDLSLFPGDWAPLKGKTVKLYTVQVFSQNPRDSGPAARLNYSIALFEEAYRDLAAANPAPSGVAVIFDAADGGIVAATFENIQKLSSGSLKREAFWQQSYLDPPDAFQPSAKPAPPPHN